MEERQEENEEKRQKQAIDKIGRDLETIKTDRQKCMEMYDAQRDEAARAFERSKTSKAKEHLEPVLNTQALPYDKEVKTHGIQPMNRECRYPIKIGDVASSECKEGQYESDTYAVKYPETEEQKLQKYYDDVLRRHEEACFKAAEYKKVHECLPGTVIQEKDDDKQLSKNVLISNVAQPQQNKLNPCLLKKSVRFTEPPDKCQQPKDDTCNLKIPKDHCGCTEYK